MLDKRMMMSIVFNRPFSPALITFLRSNQRGNHLQWTTNMSHQAYSITHVTPCMSHQACFTACCFTRVATRMQHYESRIMHVTLRMSHHASRITHFASRMSYNMLLNAYRNTHVASRTSYNTCRITHVASRMSYHACPIMCCFMHIPTRILLYANANDECECNKKSKT